MKRSTWLMIGLLCIESLFIGILSYHILRKPSIQPDEPPIVAPHINLLKIEEVAKLISIEYFMSDIVDYINPKMWPFADEKILVIAKAKISAGINLKQGFHITIQEAPLNDPTIPDIHGQATPIPAIPKVKRQIKVTLPTPEILAIDPSYKYYDIQGSPPPDAHTYLLNLAKLQLEQKALEEGILEDAKASITKQFRQMYPEIDLDVLFENTNWVVNPNVEEQESLPETVDDAARMLLSRLDESQKNRLRSVPQSELSIFQLSIGALIRNELKLWGENTKLLAACGTSNPDEASKIILR